MKNLDTQNQTAEVMAELKEEVTDTSTNDNVAELNAAPPQDETNWKDEAARALAELENVRKRHQKELADARQFAVSKFALEMLNVADNVARAQSVLPEKAEGELQTIKEGVAMVAQQFEQTLEKFQIKAIQSVGEQLNPDLHQAMQQVPSNQPAGTITAQMQAGYTIGERLLRPALVLVSNGEQPQPESE